MDDCLRMLTWPAKRKRTPWCSERTGNVLWKSNNFSEAFPRPSYKWSLSLSLNVELSLSLSLSVRVKKVDSQREKATGNHQRRSTEKWLMRQIWLHLRHVGRRLSTLNGQSMSYEKVHKKKSQAAPRRSSAFWEGHGSDLWCVCSF